MYVCIYAYGPDEISLVGKGTYSKPNDMISILRTHMMNGGH